MKRLCFVEYDMTVTGGVEQVTTSLANAFCDAYEVYIWHFWKRETCSVRFGSENSLSSGTGRRLRIRKRITSVFKPFKEYIKENEIDIVFLMGHLWIDWVNPHFIHITARFPAANLMPTLLQLSRQLSCSPGRIIRV